MFLLFQVVTKYLCTSYPCLLYGVCVHARTFIITYDTFEWQSLSIQKWFFQNLKVILKWWNHINSDFFYTTNQPITAPCLIVCYRNFYSIVGGGSDSLTPTSHTGWFARDPVILNRVGRVLLQLPDVDLVRPSRIIIAEDCFQLSDIPKDRVTQPLVKSVEKLFGSKCIDHMPNLFV